MFYYQHFTDIVLKLGRAYQWEKSMGKLYDKLLVGPTKL